MNARLIKLWQDLQSSYYFIPALMAIGAVILAYVTSHIDQTMDIAVVKKFDWLYANSPGAARAILSTIAGSMITVAGVTFSMTMVAVTSAASQYGPRLIGNFMRDKANQFTLGTFTATFVYCLLVMRVARTGDDADAANRLTEIIPSVSLLVAMIMTLMSVGVLIFFIHHIPETLNVGNITSRVGYRLRDNINKLFPTDIGESGDDDVDLSKFDLKSSHKVETDNEGYLQTLDDQAVLDIACAHDLVIRLEYRPGDFCVTGNVLAHYWSDSDDLDHDEIKKQINSCFALGNERTEHQNVLFLADELVEILGRALSPGINDPFTAINCMNWFHSALAAICQGKAPSPFRYDASDTDRLRLIAYPVSFERFLSVICDQSRPYIAADRNAALHMMTILTELAATARTGHQKELFVKQLDNLTKAAAQQLPSDVDKKEIETRHKQAKKIIDSDEVFREERDRQSWIGGRA
ncbi:MAG: DUF2254 domain-containing protein [Acidimicrobiales bacterium]|nr:DUF2254 domain-containing protein [Hyphomonadaceae bacterium]RZV41562.1 MAG: DUF2254 domain-containing protein [Acidimicrobiales bacterium]